MEWDTARRTSRLGMRLFAITIIGELLILGACRSLPKETALPFDTIEQTEWAGVKPSYELPDPIVVVIAQSGEVAGLKGVISDAARAKLQALDYSSYFALLVLQGQKPSTGYKVTIDRISRLDGNVKISATFVEPESGKETGALITSPYRLVQVHKIGAWNKDISFDLSVGDASRFSTSHFIP